jgi:HAD superfamily phosphoserine phosphatase-like hydrolase
MTPIFNPKELVGFIANDPVNVTAKIERFARAGAARIHFLFDFDQTLTTRKHTGRDVTTWQILHGLLPKEGKKISKELRVKYLALESAGKLSVQDSNDWSLSILDLHRFHGTNMNAIREIAKQVKLRDGTRELFDICHQTDIPTIILSAGIRDIIELIAHENGINPTILLSIKLQIAQDGRIIGWDKNSMVFTHNKREKVEQELFRIRAQRPLTVLVGDTLEDAQMVDGDENVLRIRVCDMTRDELKTDIEYLQQSFAAGYDMIIEEDLEPLAKLTEWLTHVSHTTIASDD